MPALAPFLANCRVLRAAHRYVGIVAGGADVAADAFADVIDAPFLDLLRQEGIGDRRARGSDEVQNALFYNPYHAVRRRIAADADHRLGRDGFDEADIGLLVAFFGETSRLAIVRPVGEIDVPKVRKFAERRNDVLPFPLAGDPGRTHQLVHREAHRQRTGVADRLAHIIQNLSEQAEPVLEGAAIFVAAVVMAAGQEVLQHAHVVAGIEIDDVEAGLFGAQRGIAIPAAHVGDVCLVHCARLDRIEAVADGVRGSERDHPAETVGDVQAVVHKLDGREAAMGVDTFRNGGKGREIAVVPKTGFVGWRQVRCRVDFRLLGGNDGPTAFSLHAAQMGFRIGIAVAHAGTVGHLIETVARRHGADLDGFE